MLTVEEIASESAERMAASCSIVAAVNNETVLQSCLLNSPGVRAASEFILQRGFKSAAAAYNDALKRAKTDVVVFVHQDVYFPEGWLENLQKALLWLSRNDPEWGVLGVWGVDAGGACAGYLYCGGSMQILGSAFEGASEVKSLDEVVLIVRKSSGVMFDERLDGFHMYGTDVCMEARRRGFKCYAISAFCLHNTNGYRMLPRDFWRGYWFIRNKWRAELPIQTSCIKVTVGCWPMIHWNIGQALSILQKRHRAGKRVDDPASLFRQIAGGPAIPHVKCAATQ